MGRRGFMIFLVVLMAFASSFGFLKDKDFSAEKGTEMFNCISEIVCVAKKPLELKRIKEKAGKELQKCSVEWLSELYNMKNAEDTDEFWENYSDYVCKYPKDKRREVVKEFIMRTAHFYENVCKTNPDIEECEKCDDAMAEGELVIAEYTEKQVCNNPRKVAGDEKRIPGPMRG